MKVEMVRKTTREILFLVEDRYEVYAGGGSVRHRIIEHLASKGNVFVTRHIADALGVKAKDVSNVMNRFVKRGFHEAYDMAERGEAREADGRGGVMADRPATETLHSKVDALSTLSAGSKACSHRTNRRGIFTAREKGKRNFSQLSPPPAGSKEVI